MRVRIGLAYDGGPFAGWARQPGQRTVQGELEAALATIWRLPDPPALTVAGRTDAGVHARQQTCHIDLPRPGWEVLGSDRSADTPDPARALVRRLNGLLPSQIRVRNASEAPAGFDARFSALARRYTYRICDQPWAEDPLRRDVLSHRRPLDVSAMDGAGRSLIGEHDYAAYCRPREGATTIRRILRLRVSREVGLVEVDIEADAFCHSMVRAVVGALVAVGEGRRGTTWPGELLAAGVRDSGLNVMPPGGLTLEEVRYPRDSELAARATLTRTRRTLW